MIERTKHTIYGSNGLSLRLTDSEYEQFKKEERELYRKYYAIEVKKRGFWSGNQGKYVSSPNEFDWMDSKVMVELLLEKVSDD